MRNVGFSGNDRYRAVQGVAKSSNCVSGNCQGRTYGVYGKAGNGRLNYAVFGKAIGSRPSAGIYGTTGPETTLDGTQYAGYFNGDVKTTGSSTGFSDRRLKEAIKPIENSLEKLMRMGTYSFRYKPHEDYEFPEDQQFGFIAQEVEKVAPRLVSQPSENGYMSLDQHQLVPLVADAVKEQQQQIQQLRSKLQARNQTVQALQEQVQQGRQARQQMRERLQELEQVVGQKAER